MKECWRCRHYVSYSGIAIGGWCKFRREYVLINFCCHNYKKEEDE